MLDRRTPSVRVAGELFDLKFRSALENAVRRQFEGHNIARVDLGWTEDFEGEDSLSVDVVINDDIDEYSGASLSDLTRRLRAVLKEFSIPAFPLVRFLSQSEANEVAA